jgi:outer membrane protein assembly factor BamB
MIRGLLIACVLCAACGGSAVQNDPPPATSVVLSVSVAGPGSVTSSQGISCPSQCSAIVPRGTAVTLTAGAGLFSSWQGCVSNTTTCTLTLDAATTVTAFFSDPQSLPPPPAVGITISPFAASLVMQGSQQFTAQVTNATDTSVDWSVQDGNAGGTVTTAGLYTAPLASGVFHVVARSHADPTKSATATVTVALLTVAVVPPTAGLVLGETLQLAAQVQNSPDATVDWSVVEGSAGGTVSAGGLYTAPQTAGTFHVMARSKLDPTKSSTAAVNTRPFVPQAVTYQIDVGHTGQISFASPLVFPDKPLWSVTMPFFISYPLIAGGKVFAVAAAAATPTQAGMRLFAFDAASGATAWGPIAIFAAAGLYGAAAYDDGKIYAYGNETLAQFDAETGAPGFNTTVGFDATTPPVASKGIVYVTDGKNSQVFAVLEATGQVLWKHAVTSGDLSSPALSGDSLFVDYSGSYYAFSQTTGAVRWNTVESVQHFFGWTPVYRDGRVYLRDTDNFKTGLIVDAASGQQVGTFPAQVIPAVSDTTAFLLDQGNLEAFDLASGKVSWSFSGDGKLTAAPILINDAVIAGSGNGAVYALDAATGAVLWTTTVPAAIGAPDDLLGSIPTPGLAAGEGILVIPAGNTLTAWRLQ